MAHIDTKTIGEKGEPGALTTDPRRRFLFAALRSTGKLASFRLDPKTGALTQVSTVPFAADPAHLTTDHDGRFLLCAYYVAGQVTIHAIGQDGSLTPKPHHSVKTADKAHAVVLDPAQRFAFVAHTGPDVIFQFAYHPKTGKLKPCSVPRLTTPKGTGPRHLVFHPSQNVAYVANEQGSSVTAYRLDGEAGTLKPFQTLTTLPPGFKGTNACAEIRLHPSGRFLYVSNRGHDSLACYRVSAADGSLKANGRVATERTPRSFDLDPGGRFLYAAGESSGKLAAYRVDGKTGGLERFATYGLGRRPWWVLAIHLPSQ